MPLARSVVGRLVHDARTYHILVRALSPPVQGLEIVSLYNSMRPQTDPSTMIGTACRSNPEDEKLKDLGYRKGWQQCVGCGNMVSRNGGCPQ